MGVVKYGCFKLVFLFDYGGWVALDDLVVIVDECHIILLEDFFWGSDGDVVNSFFGTFMLVMDWCF